MREHLDKRVKQHGREKMAALLEMTPTNLDYICQGRRARKDANDKPYEQVVPFPMEILDVLAAHEDISISEKMRQLAIETAAMDILATPEVSEEVHAHQDRDDHQT